MSKPQLLDAFGYLFSISILLRHFREELRGLVGDSD